MRQTWIKIWAQDKGFGTYRTTCPKCNGGSTREMTLVATIDATGVRYYCHRASCQYMGATNRMLTNPAQHKQAAEVGKLKPYTGQAYGPSEADYKYFLDRFGIDEHTVATYIRRTSPSETTVGDYLFPIHDPRGRKRGYVVRKPVWKGDKAPLTTPNEGGAKAMTYMHRDGATMAWYGASGWDTLVLVEDQVSAMTIASNCPARAVALLGTHLSHERVREIQQEGHKNVVLALDADATTQALNLGRKWGACFPTFRIHVLDRDVKDMGLDAEEELRWALN